MSSPLFDAGGAVEGQKAAPGFAPSSTFEPTFQPPFTTHEYLHMWKRSLQYREFAQEAESAVTVLCGVRARFRDLASQPRSSTDKRLIDVVVARSLSLRGRAPRCARVHDEHTRNSCTCLVVRA